MTISLGNGGEDGEFGIQVLSKVHDRGDIAAAVTVIRSAPDGDNGLVFEMPLLEALALADSIGDGRITYLITFIDELMCPCDKLESVDVVEFRSDFVAKQPSSTTR